MLISDPLGVVGAPLETLAELRAAVGDRSLAGGTLVLVTDRQGERGRGAYGALLWVDAQLWLTVASFGPRFGEDGARALSDLVRWAGEGGITAIRETVVPVPQFNRVLREPDEAELRAVIAASNPSDAGIYVG
ncbi:DUF3197 domain-containing protein [Deinococcus pimensis]|uniref:DUF3197 domain-containing protein n=1 Tax=Deinococcus pimensis TaxID=309888 RepID=UPI000486059E|nr:DUF3197 domain-containing protein [Deinococcus pimensis]